MAQILRADYLRISEGRFPKPVSLNRKGRSGWHQATLKASTSTCHSTGLTAHIKGLIITLAL